ncbi:MAG: amino acid adenylation domain-containing protein, partial [Myxococcales bacterium]|nr:amino acid adenylation domain-containing protein [Myxococcales bacterium]
NIPLAVWLRGPLQIESLAAALTWLVARHEALRTTLPSDDTGPWQRIAAAEAITLTPEPVDDLDDLHARVQAEARRPFDLANGPVTRAHLWRLDDDTHTLLLNVHHVAFDGWSIGVALRELSHAYTALAAGAAPALPPLTLDYADFAVWQRRWLTGEALLTRLVYWKQALADAPVLDLPTDHPRPAMRSNRGACVPVAFDAALTDGIDVLCRAHGITPFMALLAGLSVVLSRHSGQDDIVIGSPIANRNRAELEGLVGFFVNTLAPRVDLSGELTVAELLARVRKTTLDAYAHQDAPFERVVDALGAPRDTSRTPLFQVMLVLQNAPLDPPDFGAVTIKPFESESTVAKFDLTLSLTQTAEGMTGGLEYCAALFERTTIERLAEHLRMALTAMVEAPAQRLSAVELITPTERALLAAWNDTARPFRDDVCVHVLFAEQVERTPDAIAVVFEGEQITYRELFDRANALAGRLRDLGIRPEVRVGLHLQRSMELIVATVATALVGGACLALDANYPVARLEFVADDARPAVVIGRGPDRPAWYRGPWLDVAASQADAIDVRRGPERATAAPASAMYVIYTSGSTGRPKGVIGLHGGMVNRLSWPTHPCPLGADAVVLGRSSPNFGDAIAETWGPLVHGARLVVLPTGFDASPRAIARLIAAQGVTHLVVVPSLLAPLLPMMQAEPASFASLRCIHSSGEALDAGLASAVMRALPDCLLLNLYGASEVSADATALICRPGRPGEMTVGRPLPNTTIRLCDARLRTVPIGVPGEVHVAGVGLARGYLNRPGLTAERFVPDPFGPPGSRMYRTGDRARWQANGELEYLGRVDLQLKIRGFRIEPGEIEAALSAHEAVQRCVVMAHAEPGRDPRLVAWLVGDAIPVAALRAHLAESLPDYMIPSVFVWLDALPLTPNGKVDRAALPAPELDRETLTARFVAPRTATEETLAQVWAEVLGVDQVGVEDNFFELGGDSILSIQVVFRAARRGVVITPRQFFERPTVAGLAGVADAAERRVISEPGLVEGEAPLSPIQRWFFAQGFAEAHHWNQAVCLVVPAAWDRATLSEALRLLVGHHDALRLAFDGQRAWHAPVPASIAVETLDLSMLAPSARDAAQATAATRLQGSMRLTDAPLLRALRVDRGDEGARLVLAIHHLVIDGVSWRVLLDDLERACAAIARGDAVDLGPKTVSWRRFVEAQQAWADADRTAEVQAWRAMIETPVAALPLLPAPRPSSQACATVELSTERTAALLRRAGRAYQTEINDLLLTALALALQDWTGGPAVGVCLEGHGREQGLLGDLDVSRTVGWFTTMFPVRLVPGAVDGTDGIADAIRSVKAQLRAVPHRGITHGMLRWLAPLDSLTIPPTFGVVFNYLGRVAAGAGLGVDAGPVGERMGRRNHRTAPVAFNGLVLDGRLQMRVDWARERFADGAVERLADGFMGWLEAIIAHCEGLAPADEGPATPRVVLSEGVTLATLEWGPLGGSPVLCLHGRLDHAGSWAPVAERLRALGAHVMAVDLRGHGCSGHATSYDWPGFVADGLAALAALPGRVTLVGHSLGAGLALSVRMLAPERVRHLVLIEPDLRMAPADDLDVIRARLSMPGNLPALPSLAEALRRIREALPGVPEARLRARVARLTETTPDGLFWRWDGRLLAEAYAGTPRRETLLGWLADGTVPMDWIRATGGLMVEPEDFAAMRALGAHLREHTLEGQHHLHLQAPRDVARIIARRIFGRHA